MDFTNMKVLVIGDTCLDIIEDGVSTRLSPEAPVPVILNPTKTYSVGMAGNVAMNLKSLGADVYLSTAFTNDKYGKEIARILINENIKQYGAFHSIETGSTIVKKRILANGKQVARIDKEEKIKISSDNMSLYMNTIGNLKFDLIIISDYNKGIITVDTWTELQKVVWEQNKGRIFVDTKKTNPMWMFEGCILTPNKTEMENILDANDCTTPYDLLLELDTEFIIETLSDGGARAYKKDGIISSNATAQSVVDVTGAGDTFIAAFSLYYTKFGNIKRALDFANYCCGKVVQKKGTATINISEVLDFESNRQNNGF